jgi:hypothetical protein
MLEKASSKAIAGNPDSFEGERCLICKIIWVRGERIRRLVLENTRDSARSEGVSQENANPANQG